MCIYPAKNPKILPFSKKSWNSFLKYVPQWKSLDGVQAEIAKRFIDKHPECAEFNSHDSSNTLPIPWNGGFHQTCYSRFTDSQRVQRVIKNVQKKSETGRFFIFKLKPKVPDFYEVVFQSKKNVKKKKEKRKYRCSNNMKVMTDIDVYCYLSCKVLFIDRLLALPPFLNFPHHDIF